MRGEEKRKERERQTRRKAADIQSINACLLRTGS